MKVEIIQAEALVVGPDEVLILRLPADLGIDRYYEVATELTNQLAELGVLNIVVDGHIELAKIKPPREGNHE